MAISSAIVPYKGNTSSAIVKPKQKLSGGHAVSDKSADAGRSMRRSALLLMRRRIQRDRLEKKYFGLLDKQKQKAKARAEEEKQEQTSFLSGVGSGVKKSAEKLGGNLFGALGDLLGFLALNWMADPANQKVLEGIVKGVGAVIKFIDWWVTGSVINLFDGFHKLITGDSILERVLGFFQMVTGAVGIFYALNPHKAIIHSFKLIKGAPKITQFFRIFFKKWQKKGIGNALKFMFPKTAKVLKGISEKLSSVFKIPAAKEWTVNIITKIKSKLSSIFKIPQLKNLVKKVLSKIKIGGGNLFKGKGIVNLIAKKLIALSKGKAGAAVKTALRTIVKPATNIIKNIPIIGPLIGFGVNMALGDPPGVAAFKAVGATMGQWLGAAVGTLLFPGVGTFLGGLIGNLLGDFLGGRMYQMFQGKQPSASTREERERGKLLRKAAHKVEKGKMTQDEADLWVEEKLIDFRSKWKNRANIFLDVPNDSNIGPGVTTLKIKGKGDKKNKHKNVDVASGQYLLIGEEIMKVLTNKSVENSEGVYQHNLVTVKRGVDSEAGTHWENSAIRIGKSLTDPIVKDMRIVNRTHDMNNGSKIINFDSKLNSNNGNNTFVNNTSQTVANYTTVNSVNTNTNNNTDQKNL